jgi:hypothetical protein
MGRARLSVESRPQLTRRLPLRRGPWVAALSSRRHDSVIRMSHPIATVPATQPAQEFGRDACNRVQDSRRNGGPPGPQMDPFGLHSKRAAPVSGPARTRTPRHRTPSAAVARAHGCALGTAPPCRACRALAGPPPRPSRRDEPDRQRTAAFPHDLDFRYPSRHLRLPSRTIA